MIYLIIQLTGTDIVAAAFEKRRNSLAFLQGVRKPLPESGSLEGVLDGFSKLPESRKIILAVPTETVHARELSLPISDRKRLREILPLELAGEMASSADDMVFDALSIEDGRLLALWCRQRELSDLIARLAEAGIEPEIVTSSCAHLNILIPENVSSNFAVLDGNSLMIGSRRSPLMLRALSEWELETDLARTIAAFEVGSSLILEGVTRFGRGVDSSESGTLSRELTEAFGGDTMAAADLAGAYAVAAAALSGNIVNFRSGALAYRAGHDKAMRRLRLTMALAAVLILLVFVETGVRFYLVKRDLDSVNASISAIYKEIFPSRKKPVDPVAEVGSEIRRLSGGGSSQQVLAGLKRLTELKGNDITGFYEIEFDSGQVRLKGDARTTQAVNDFKLKAAGFLAQPEVSEIKSKSDGSVSFLFRGTLKEAGR